jgi:hypothetical protein
VRPSFAWERIVSPVRIIASRHLLRCVTKHMAMSHNRHWSQKTKCSIAIIKPPYYSNNLQQTIVIEPCQAFCQYAFWVTRAGYHKHRMFKSPWFIHVAKVNPEDEAEYDIQETNTSPYQDVEGVTPLSHSINNGYLAILQDCITHSPQQVHGLWCTVSQTLGLSPMLPYQGNEFPISLNN